MPPVAGQTWLQYYNEQINKLVNLRDDTLIVMNHKTWLTPAGVTSAKAAFAADIVVVKAALDEVNAYVQTL